MKRLAAAACARQQMTFYPKNRQPQGATKSISSLRASGSPALLQHADALHDCPVAAVRHAPGMQHAWVGLGAGFARHDAACLTHVTHRDSACDFSRPSQNLKRGGGGGGAACECESHARRRGGGGCGSQFDIAHALSKLLQRAHGALLPAVRMHKIANSSKRRQLPAASRHLPERHRPALALLSHRPAPTTPHAPLHAAAAEQLRFCRRQRAWGAHGQGHRRGRAQKSACTRLTRTRSPDSGRRCRAGSRSLKRARAT